ncbi:MAG TPA: DUF983 domain-containing protein, partial [Gemmatimonadaceae bacterium]|nr:DUF983 domain-containing protein [Gemmatimonadaceae bacterium]
MSTEKASASAAQIAGRALRLRCPNCGSKGFVESWFRLAPACPTCGLDPERYDEGLAVGALAFNLVTGEFVALGACVAIALATWPEPPWNTITVIGIALGITMPVLFYPFSKTLFAGLNLYFKVFDPETKPRFPPP